MQPVHRRAVCDGLPDRGDVQAARRHRRLRQGDLHRLQGVHGGLPLRRDLHQPRRPFGREVQHLRPPTRRRVSSPPASRCARPRAIIVGDGNDPTSKVAQTRERATRSRCDGRRRRPARSVFYLGAHQATLDPLGRPAPRAASTPGPAQGAPDPQLVTAGHPQAGHGRRLPRCCPTTSPTMRRGAGGSASTRGRRASPQAPSCWPSLLALTGLLDWSRRGRPLGRLR